jgi:hypothetical protein
MLLGREGILDEYFTSPRMFVQSSDFESTIHHETPGTPECDPTGKERSEDVFNKLELYDPYMMARITQSPAQNMISLETRLLKDAPSPATAELGRTQIMSKLCEGGNTKFCEDENLSSLSVENCRILGGSLLNGQVPSEPSRLFLQKLDEADLDGVVIWGLRPDQDHSHRYVHESMKGAVEEALIYSERRRHLCYVKETPGFDLGRDLYGDSSRGKMARSLVFASPKHMTWSADPGFLTLPVESTSRYIFHGETPRPHTALKRAGFAVEWETWGPDGNVPIIDSDIFVRGEAWKPRQGCVVDEKRKTFHCPNESLFIQPWASEYTPEQILSNRERATSVSLNDQTETLHFVGTIWSCNFQEFIDFTRGCSDHGINVVRHGQWMLHTKGGEMRELTSLPNFSMETMNGRSPEELFQSQSAVYAPAFQGSCHLQDDPSKSYIADRILNLISIGVYPMTNNPSTLEYLGGSEAIVFNTNTSQLCGSMMGHHSSQESLIELMGIVAQEHTYVSRLSAILDFVSSPSMHLDHKQETGIDREEFMQQLLTQMTVTSSARTRRRTATTHKNRFRIRGSAATSNAKMNGEDTGQGTDELLRRNIINFIRSEPPMDLSDGPSSSPSGSPTFDYDIPQFTPAPMTARARAPTTAPAEVSPPPLAPSEMSFSIPLDNSLSLSLSLFSRDIELQDDFFELDERVDVQEKRTRTQQRPTKRRFADEKPGERLEVAAGKRKRRRLIRVRE